MNRPLRVCVLGAGAIGLSSAMCLLEAFPGVQLTVIADSFSPDTTSDVAAGVWFPHALGDTPISLIRRWGAATLDYLRRIQDDSALTAGIQMLSGYMIEKADPNIRFADLLPRWTKMTNQEVALFSRDLTRDHPALFTFTAMMCEGAIYTQWLMERVNALGATLVTRRLDTLKEVYDEYEVIVNCSGSGAAKLVPDDKVYVLRGQVVKVHAPWVKHFYGINDGEYYIIPGQKSVTLGGTHQKNNWDKTPRKRDADDILQGCCRLLPSLKEARVVGHAAGLRPCRSSVRLEDEIITHNGKTIQLIHNYGHGGAGLTLHYGCAQDVVKLVQATNAKAKL